MYKVSCNGCGPYETTKEEFEKYAGEAAMKELEEKIDKGESLGGLLVFDKGCPRCMKGKGIDAKLFSIRREMALGL